MSKHQELSENYKFATSNGYKKSMRQYIEENYSAYASICKRCKIKPMDFTQWVNS